MARKCSDPLKRGCTNEVRCPTPGRRRYYYCSECNADKVRGSRENFEYKAKEIENRSARSCEHCGRKYTTRSFRCPRCRLDVDGEPMERALWLAVKDMIYLSDGRACVYCGAEAGDVDHVRPKLQGGMDNEENLVPACKNCNRGRGGKHSKLLTQWDPVRVEYGRQHSPKVQAEWLRLTGAQSGRDAR